MHKSLFAAVLMGFVEIASAQAASPEGNWVGTMGPGPSGLFLKIEMSIADGGNTGTWRMTPPAGKSSRNNACFRKDMPVVVKRSSDTELQLEVHGDGVLKGCIEAKGVMKYDGKTIEGNFQDGGGVKLSRP